MLPPGTVIGDRYELIERVGSGGMGVVYRAHDRRLSREVAVKLLHPGPTDDPSGRDRFEREARAAAGLSHPGLVSVFDYGRSEDGSYLVMELLSARTLADDLAERGPMPAGDAVALIRQVAEAVGAAHAAGVTHRDLKPSNVLFAPDGRPKVADFGLARSDGASRITQTGQAVGSVHHISPEQARGEPAGPGSDVYSLGAMLFQLLTGSVPFDAETPVAVAFQHVHTEPSPPSVVRPDLDIPGWLDDLVLRTLAKDPSDRPADAAALAAELRTAPTQARDERSTTSPIPVIVPLPQDGPDPVVPAVDARDEEVAEDPRRNRTERLVVTSVILVILLAVGLLARSMLLPAEVTAGPGVGGPVPGPSSSPTPRGTPSSGPSGPATSDPSTSSSSSPSPTTPAGETTGAPSPSATTPAPATTTVPPTSPPPSPSPSPSPDVTGGAAPATSPGPGTG